MLSLTNQYNFIFLRILLNENTIFFSSEPKCIICLTCKHKFEIEDRATIDLEEIIKMRRSNLLKS